MPVPGVNMPASRTRSRVVFCRLSNEELSQLLQARDTFGFCSTSEAIRSAVMRMINEQQVETDHLLLVQVRDTVVEIRRIVQDLTSVQTGSELPPTSPPVAED